MAAADSPSKTEASASTKLASLLLYATCSMVISMVYKGVLSSFDFQAPFTLLALQTLVALGFTTFAQVRQESACGLRHASLATAPSTGIFIRLPSFCSSEI